MNLADLKKPFAPDKVSWRVGSTTADKSKGMALCYIDARDVQDRLDEVCGQAGWQCRYLPMHDKKTVCEIGIYCEFHQTWIWKSDGAGDSDIEAEKGALSDAFKRAAVRWGIGRYLYDLDSPWVELDTYEKQGKVFAKGIKAAEHKRLQALLSKDARASSEPAQPKPAPAAIPQQTQTETPPGATILPADWLKRGIERVKTLDRVSLDAFSEKYHDKIAKCRISEPDLHKSLIETIQARHTILG